MKKIKKFYSLAIAGVLLAGISGQVKAEGNNVTLPKFNVTLNGQKVENEYSKYPLIVYKDITYFPMTYNTTRFLGVETNWNESSGLDIKKTGIAGNFDNYKTDVKNVESYQVSIPTFKITVNGKVVDNSKEEFPLLVFRDVTYFPMTWKFSVDEFGWEYNFTNENGLVIKSTVKKVEEKKTEEKKVEKAESEYKDSSKTVFYNGYYYVVKTNGKDYRLFKDNIVGQESKMVSDKEIKDIVQDGNKLYFESDKTVYYYDMDKGSVNTALSNATVKDGKIVSLDKDIYWVNAKDGELYSKDNKKLNEGATVITLEKKLDYVIATFNDDKDAKYKLIVFDKDGKEVYKTENEVTDIKIENNELTFVNKKTDRTETIKLDK
ncbi:hypothetical protein SAMN02745245_01026 [Anaerosphaera aminiphila DSM 21120]|uniref:DUF5050 domain-containing protein n=1 Tax=Anaerosphaera aminiphila DSM 21120 TaxID=1120995 RepID=A0A1M5RWW2_9FIRM|nr:hypothetical protein [Anaerosphaera aminiphila]SHH30671.1 hypothetical protein SAMN02745245_01026 [Anaerosphaera aminiphila DSM 21120]